MQQQQAPQIPSKEEVKAQLTQLIVQRANLKDQVEQVEKQLPTLQAVFQILSAQEEAASQAGTIAKEVIKD